MKNTVLVSLILCSVIFAYGQDKVERIDVDALWEKIGNYGSDNEFEKALREVRKIPKDDSTYYTGLTSQAYYLTSLEKYDEAIKIADLGLNVKNASEKLKYYFHINKVAALLNSKSFDEAIKAADSALAIYPKNYKLLYNKGLAYIGLEDPQNASKMFQASITYDPFYANSHLKLGILCYENHLISQAMMCFNTYLTLNPDGEASFDILTAYNNMVKSKNTTEKKPNVTISADDDAFEEIDLIINNYAALTKNYKTGNKIDLALVKQNHAMMSRLNKFEGNGGFWDQFYVPLHKYIFNNNLFNPFTYTITYSVENEKLKKIVNKNISAIKDFIPKFKSEMMEIMTDQEIEKNGNKEKVAYLYNEARLAGIGSLKNGKLTGYWEIYSKQGRLIGFGDYNDEGEKQGNWTWYDEDGNLSEKVVYEKGKITGEYQSFHPNGRPKTVARYKEGERDGPCKIYNKDGALIESSNYKKGEYDGEFISYYPMGEKYVSYRVLYVDGKIQGKVILYFETGGVKKELNFVDGKKNGMTTAYFINGNVESKTEYKDDDPIDKYTEYHLNGQVYYEGGFENGKKNGIWKYYYMDGTLNSESNFKDGEKDGSYKNYDTDGKIFYEYTYRRGEIIAYKFYNKKGEVIKEAKKQGGEFLYQGHASNGNIISEGTYDVSGGKIGNWKFYTDYHDLSAEEVLNDKSEMMSSKSYYPNGQVKSISNYDRDTVDGYYVSFHPNGEMKQQGWYIKGKAEGYWMDYYMDGTKMLSTYYTHDKKYGTQESYTIDGKLAASYLYDDGDIQSEKYFDKDGNVVEEINLVVDSLEYKLINKYANGSVDNSFSMLYGVRNGPYYGDYFSGKKFVTGGYLNGERHGVWKWYHENGKLKMEGEYIFGLKNGTWNEYHENGELSEVNTYIYGGQVGEQKAYNDQGVFIRRKQFVNDELHGRVEFYSEDGKLQLVRFYEHGILIGYSYLGKDGKEIPMIPMENETGKIVAYFPNGKVSRELEYHHGMFVNEYKEYYSTGQLFEGQTYKDDELNGGFVRYYPNGTLKTEMQYLNGELNGVAKEYHPNGKLKEESTYRNDEKIGTSKYYNANGKLIMEREYFDGEVISEKTF